MIERRQNKRAFRIAESNRKAHNTDHINRGMAQNPD
jgi:hypothetical protein